MVHCASTSPLDTATQGPQVRGGRGERSFGWGIFSSGTKVSSNSFSPGSHHFIAGESVHVVERARSTPKTQTLQPRCAGLGPRPRVLLLRGTKPRRAGSLCRPAAQAGCGPREPHVTDPRAADSRNAVGQARSQEGHCAFRSFTRSREGRSRRVAIHPHRCVSRRGGVLQVRCVLRRQRGASCP